MFGELLLGAWSLAGLLWWLLAWSLVSRNERQRAIVPTSPKYSLSVFKPLPPLDGQGIAAFEPGLESFVAQLDAGSELLLGLHEDDRAATASFRARLLRDYPEARIEIVWRSGADDLDNPKIAWQEILAPHATGELWLWSDADIVAPPGFLHAAQGEFEQGDAELLTFPYVVRNIPSPPAILTALFVNADFYPGVLLLRRLGPIDFGLGAGMLFRRDTFLKRIDWSELGAVLSDDFFLGQRLRPARIGGATLTTVADAYSWSAAFSHDLRWAKTIWWNRPVGSAARIFILPSLGWLAFALLHPLHPAAWAGLFVMMQIDVGFAWLLCRRIGCPLAARDFLSLEGWSLWRMLLWLLCWLPVSVVWSGKTWKSPGRIEEMPTVKSPEVDRPANAVDKIARETDL